MPVKLLNVLWVLVWCAALLNALHWFTVRQTKPAWLRTPPPPGQVGALAMGLGDAQFSYRIIGILLQNMGDQGGETTRLDSYDFDILAKWFYLTADLDDRSSFAPYLAAFYFSGSQDPNKLPPLIEYLYAVGNSTAGERFRWLGQAVYLARYKLQDMDWAYDMAQTLANLNRPLPFWAKAMPALVKSEAGEKDAAVAMLTSMLADSADKLHPNEVNSTIALICERLLDAEAAKLHPLCQDNPL